MHGTNTARLLRRAGAWSWTAITSYSQPSKDCAWRHVYGFHLAHSQQPALVGALLQSLTCDITGLHRRPLSSTALGSLFDLLCIFAELA